MGFTMSAASHVLYTTKGMTYTRRILWSGLGHKWAFRILYLLGENIGTRLGAFGP